MAEKTHYFCDICEKEIVGDVQCASFVIFSQVGTRQEIEIDKKYVGSRVGGDKSCYYYGWPQAYHMTALSKEYQYLACEDCIGEELTPYKSQRSHFSLANGAKTFLARIGLLKNGNSEISC